MSEAFPDELTPAAIAAAPAEAPSANFDRIARLYRWMEYASLGPLLERVRWHLLDAGPLDGACRGLILGDGDGRFTARLLLRNRGLRAEAVDGSAAMLRLLKQRCAFAGNRLSTTHEDARRYQPPPEFDLVVTHFFLDCLAQEEVDALVCRVARDLQPGALWVVSEFRIAAGWLEWPSRLFVRSLYFAFRCLTGLRVTRLPNHASALRAAGFVPVAQHLFAGGLLTSELWQGPARNL
jgi:SAM-dependent methyltransferase